MSVAGCWSQDEAGVAGRVEAAGEAGVGGGRAAEDDGDQHQQEVEQEAGSPDVALVPLPLQHTSWGRGRVWSRAVIELPVKFHSAQLAMILTAAISYNLFMHVYLPCFNAHLSRIFN